jgi:hypothetical protein
MAGLADQVNDCPVILPLLNIAKRQGDDLRPSQSKAEEERDDCGVALLAKCLGSGSREELSAPPSAALSQLPTRRPSCGTPFTRRMPATSSGLSNPVSPPRRPGASLPRAERQSWMRRASGLQMQPISKDDGRFNAKRGSEQYHSMNSSMACWYDRRDCRDVRLLSTDLLVWSSSGRVGRSGAGFDYVTGLLSPAIAFVAIRSYLQLVRLLTNMISSRMGINTDFLARS